MLNFRPPQTIASRCAQGLAAALVSEIVIEIGGIKV